MEGEIKDSKIEFFTQGELEKIEKKRQLEKKEMRRFMLSQNKGKVASLAVAIAYLLVGLFGGGETFLYVIAFLILPLALIWLPDYFAYSMNSPVNPITGFTGITQEPVGNAVVKFIGWVVLLGPVIRIVVIMLLS